MNQIAGNMGFDRPQAQIGCRTGSSGGLIAVPSALVVAVFCAAWSQAIAQGDAGATAPREVPGNWAHPESVAADGTIRWRLLPRDDAAPGDSAAGTAAAGSSAGTAGGVRPTQGRPARDESPQPGALAAALPAALDELVLWGAFVEPRRAPLMIFRDGGVLAADIVELSASGLTIDHDLFGERTLPIGQVRAIVLQWPAGRAARDRVAGRWRGPGRADGQAEVILDNGDRLLGRPSIGRDGRVELSQGDRRAAVPADRVAQILFAALPAAEEERRDAAGFGRSWVGWTDGTCLLVEQLVVAGEQLSFRAFGSQWKGSARSLAAIQPLGARVAYLSDRQPNAYRHVPFLDAARPYCLDATATGGWPRCRGQLYRKAIGMTSAARLGFAVEPRATAFAAAVGIDDTTDGGGSVRVRVFVDGLPRWSSEIIRGGQPPVDLSVELNGASQLDLVVDFADRADVLDRVLWLNPRLILRAE